MPVGHRAVMVGEETASMMPTKGSTAMFLPKSCVAERCQSIRLSGLVGLGKVVAFGPVSQRRPRSRTVTSTPAPARRSAETPPPKPEPMTMTWWSSVRVGRLAIAGSFGAVPDDPSGPSEDWAFAVGREPAWPATMPTTVIAAAVAVLVRKRRRVGCARSAEEEAGDAEA